MFSNPFSFDGRIRRSEYGISFFIFFVGLVIINAIGSSNKDAAMIFLAYIPLYWFCWAQGAKRCHDVGNSGWWQIIPFYVLWLIFQDGHAGFNEYGENPKGIQVVGRQTTIQGGQISGTSGGYQGGYSGGHNNPASNYPTVESQEKKDGYSDGDLYK